MVMNHERRALDDTTRALAPGRFVKLSDGWVHYRTAGAAGRPAIVLVHGFNGPMTTWNRNFDALAGAGFRVLSYDLFGRGYSDRPAVTYDLDVFVRQLEELLATTGFGEPPTLIGSSFGSIVATEFALRHPDKTARLILVGPAGFPSPADRLAGFLGIPILSDYIYRIIGDRQMLAITRKYYVEPDRFPEAHAAFREQIAFKGYKRAALSTLRHSPLRDYASGWTRIGKREIPLLLIWGRQDVSFPYANHEAALRMMPQARLVTVEGAAHLPQYEQPEVVNASILKFMTAQHSDRSPLSGMADSILDEQRRRN